MTRIDCRQTFRLAALLMFAMAASAKAEDAFFEVRLDALELTEGKFPNYAANSSQFDGNPFAARGARPYAAMDGDGEAIISGWPDIRFFVVGADRTGNDGVLHVRAPAGKAVVGRLYVPKADRSGHVILRFRIPAEKAGLEHRTAFYRERQSYYEQLAGRGIAGGAWFRHQARESRLALHEQPGTVTTEAAPFGGGGTELADTFALFSGGRALSENLQLDRGLLVTQPGESTVDVGTLQGITIAEIDWSKLLEGKEPKLDPLASAIPADQHVVFFPSFAAYLRVMDESRSENTAAPILQAAEPRAENAGTVARYEAQLAVPLTVAARLLGPQVVKSVALTGSDPYYRVGTDLALVFETSQPEVLHQALLAQIKLNTSGNSEVNAQQGVTGGLEYSGARSADRRVCTYVAATPNAVILTNSLKQLEQLGAVREGQSPSLASLPEFKFFRDRYPLGDESETAFIFLSDATIRRWCGPHWRIATSRRTRDVAVLAEMQAVYFEKLVRGTAQPGFIHTDLPLANAGELSLEKDGVRSSTYNTLGFQTPIAEIPLDRVTQQEADGYQRWRDQYQQNWRWAFDPIGLRLTITDERLAADMTVMPLIAGTEYRDMISITQGSKIPAGAGDPHNALAHVVFAINRDSLPVRQYSAFATAMAPGAKIDVLGWLGDTISLYLDDDPFWAEMAKAGSSIKEREEFFRQQGFGFPLGVRIDVRSKLQVAAFLTALRAFVEQTAPNLTAWESLKYNEQSYVKVQPTARATGEVEGLDKSALYYSVIGDSLLFTPNEGVLKRAIDRQLVQEKSDGQADPATANAWLGDNVSAHVEVGVVQALMAVNREDYEAGMQQIAWSNLPILNEWRRLFPDRDPVDIHEKYWAVRPVCPGGGEYVWNEEFQTMESTAYGHPGAPQPGPKVAAPLTAIERGDFGLTFEEQGLRARLELERKKQ